MSTYKEQPTASHSHPGEVSSSHIALAEAPGSSTGLETTSLGESMTNPRVECSLTLINEEDWNVDLNDGGQDPLHRSDDYFARWTTSGDFDKTSTRTKFHYLPMTSGDKIRLLHLRPGQCEDLLSCELQEVSLDSDASYEALSYVWGPDQHVYPLCVDYENGRSSGFLSMGLNLFEALHEFRTVDTVRTLWVDRICINQNDLEERSGQVPLMGQIFSRASRVLVWFGWQAYDAYLTKSELETLLEKWNAYCDQIGLENRAKSSLRYTQHVNDFTRETYEKILPRDLPAYMPALNRLASIRRNAWFHRVWTFQEAGLNSCVDIFWLGLMIPLPWLAATLMFLKRPRVWQQCYSDSYLYNSRLPPVLAQIRGKNGQYVPLSLLEAIFRTRALKATEPRDKLYALLDTLDETSRNKILPNYEESIHDVYTNAAEKCIAINGNVRLLELVQPKIRPHESGLPSWVPDLRKIKTTILFTSAIHVFGPYSWVQDRAFAAGDTKCHAEVSKHLELSLKAIHLGTVTAYHEQPRVSGKVLAEARQTLAREMGLLDALTDCLLILSGLLPSQPGRPPRYLPWYKTLRTRNAKALAEFDSSMHSDQRRLQSWMNNNVEANDFALMAVDHNCLGLCNPGVQTGDEVYIILGHDWPAVLRPTSNGEFLFRGFSCVNGVMRGEALVEARAKLHPELDKEDYWWLFELEGLKVDELPFETETVTLV